MMDVMGFVADHRVERMVARVERLSPRIALRFGLIAESHHATGGAEIFPTEIRVSLRHGHITNDLLGHELAHVIIGLEHPHLAISDRIPRGTADRRMIGTIISMFEHPAVYNLMREHGFDVVGIVEPKMADYVEDFQRLPPEKLPNVYIEKIQGYVELRYLLPNDARWATVEREFPARAPTSYGNAREIATNVMTHDRIARHAYKEMLDAFIHAMKLQSARWPPLVQLRSAARTDQL